MFYRLLAAVVLVFVVVAAYDLRQGVPTRIQSGSSLAFDPASGAWTIEVPAGDVTILYASMFGPGEPVMEVRGALIGQFEADYSQRLSSDPRLAPDAATVRQAREKWQQQVRRLQAAGVPADGGAAWLSGHGLRIAGEAAATNAPATELVRAALASLQMLTTNLPSWEHIRVAPRVAVHVDARWQGRWVLAANRPRFLTGRDVPDLIEGGKEELYALAQDDYAVPLDLPLPGRAAAPMDEPDTYGISTQRWRDAFLPGLLEESRYPDLPDAARRTRMYLVPMTCYSWCLFYNEALFERAGIKAPPQTWPEFLDVCQRLRAAGIVPLTADQDAYSNIWMDYLIFRALGPETWQRTVCGVPADAPPAARASDPPWTDPRYVRVFDEIRGLVDRGYFDADMRGSAWPAAQRAFASGQAAMMLNGSWLVQELSSYRETAGEDKFRLRCFSFPRWPDGDPASQGDMYGGTAGFIVCRQGHATAHAIELARYLSAREWPAMVHHNAQISCRRDADFPPALAGIERDFRNAPRMLSRSPSVYARRFSISALQVEYRAFFLAQKGAGDYRDGKAFTAAMAIETARYLQHGGEEGFE